MLGDSEHKNLGVFKNYVSSFASNVDDNIEKARKKAGMSFLPTLTVVKQTTHLCQVLEASMFTLPAFLALNCLH